MRFTKGWAFEEEVLRCDVVSPVALAPGPKVCYGPVTDRSQGTVLHSNNAQSTVRPSNAAQYRAIPIRRQVENGPGREDNPARVLTACMAYCCD